MRRTHSYGNGGQVKCYADGGSVKKNPLPPPKKGGKPKRITTPGKPGDTGPGGATPARNDPKYKGKKMADGGKVKKKVSKKPAPKPKPEMLGTGMAARAGQGILDARKRREKDAGL